MKEHVYLKREQLGSVFEMRKENVSQFVPSGHWKCIYFVNLSPLLSSPLWEKRFQLIYIIKLHGSVFHSLNLCSAQKLIYLDLINELRHNKTLRIKNFDLFPISRNGVPSSVMKFMWLAKTSDKRKATDFKYSANNL